MQKNQTTADESFQFQNRKRAEPCARANAYACHAACFCTPRAKHTHGSSITFGKKFMTYYGDRNTLIKDLIRYDYFIESAAPNPAAKGQRFEIRLRGGSVVSWDEGTGSLIVQGTDASIVEAKLKKVYESGLLSRVWQRKHEFILSNIVSVILAAASVLAGVYLSHQ